MPSILHVFIGAAAATLYWTALGFPFARQLIGGRVAWAIAPALGWAMQSAAALPIFFLLGFRFGSALLVCAIMLGISLLVARAPAPKHVAGDFPLWAFAGAAILALAPAAAVLPKAVPDGIGLAMPIFDHAKVAIIDHIARGGLPASNPFFGPVGEPSPLAYYYLWHFSAAELSLLTGVTGWEADAAMAWFTAFSGLTLMAGLAVWFGIRASGAAWALLFAFSGSIRPLLLLAVPGEAFGRVILPNWGFGGWFHQLGWAPQHIAAASSAVLAIFVIALAAHRRRFLQIPMLALLAVAACESSAWIGGIVLPAAAAVAGATVLIRLTERESIRFLLWAGAAALAALAVAAPFLREQLLALPLRASGPPIAFEPWGVLGVAFPESVRRILDLPAYWLVLLVLEVPAIFILGILGLWSFFRMPEAPEKKVAAVILAELAAAGLLVSWFFASKLADNNDLGWRSALPAFVVLITFAASALPRSTRLVFASAIVLLFLSLPGTIGNIQTDIVPLPSASAPAFADSPELWTAVRRHAAEHERIANNPAFMADVTAWPVNISWALIANRASCFAGRELALAFVAIPHARRIEVEGQFERIFAGRTGAGDLKELATHYDCRVVVLTPQDGAWTADPFAGSAFFALVEANDKWRLYRRTNP
jgi:hypothetical protein